MSAMARRANRGVVGRRFDPQPAAAGAAVAPHGQRADAGRALRGLRLWPLLDGFRGTAPADVGALEHAIVALARFAADVPEVAELDVNPVMARPDGCALVDVRMRLAVAEEPGLSARQLRRTW